MFQWFESVAGSTYASAMLWTLAALVLLLVVLVLIKIVRSLTFGTFVAGGRNRKTRLAVMDAAAVDSQRRLVLVRRDDVEHLVLIGGANDLVIEQNIRLAAPLLRPGAEDAPRQFEERARPAPVVVEPAHAPRPPVQPQRPVDPVQIAEARPQDQRPVEQLRRPEARPAEHHPQQAARPVVAPLRPVPPAQAAPRAQPLPPRPAIAPQQNTTPGGKPSDIDSALLQELETTLDRNVQTGSAPAPQASATPASIEEEMSKLLGELSGKKR